MLWSRNYAVVMAGGLAVLLFSLVGAAAITGVLPVAESEKAPKKAGRLAHRHACRDCGVVAEVRPVGARPHVYRVILRMDDGSERVVSQATEPPFGAGARVRLKNGSLQRG